MRESPNLFIDDILCKIIDNKDLPLEVKRKTIKDIISLKNKIIRKAQYNAINEGKSCIGVEEIKKIAKEELKDYLFELNADAIIRALNRGVNWQKTHFNYGSAWETSILIWSLLEYGENKDSEAVIVSMWFLFLTVI